MRHLAKIAFAVIGFLLVYSTAQKVFGQDNLGEELDKYVPLSQGICEDVQLPCVRAILKTTDMYYVVFGKDGKIVAITKMSPDGKEVTVWGTLPLRTTEKDI